MPVYSCRNCSNLKNRIITKDHIRGIKENRIVHALVERDPDSLGLEFPFNLTIYKRILKHGDCKILYCSEHMLQRDAYVARENSKDITPEVAPCPKYK